MASDRKMYTPSPFLTALHPWFNNPDTKFKAEGLYHADLVGSGPEVERIAEDLTQKSDAALAEYIEKKALKGSAKAAWSPYYPFTREEDEDGNPTGRIIFHVKQNAKIKLKDDTTKEVKIGLRDADDKVMTAPIYSGSEVRVMWSPRVIVMTSSKQVGVRLDFSMVQVKKLAERRAGGSGFGAVEGGYTEDQPSGFGQGSAAAADDEVPY